MLWSGAADLLQGIIFLATLRSNVLAANLVELYDYQHFLILRCEEGAYLKLSTLMNEWYGAHELMEEDKLPLNYDSTLMMAAIRADSPPILEDMCMDDLVDVDSIISNIVLAPPAGRVHLWIKKYAAAMGPQAERLLAQELANLEELMRESVVISL